MQIVIDVDVLLRDDFEAAAQLGGKQCFINEGKLIFPCVIVRGEQLSQIKERILVDHCELQERVCLAVGSILCLLQGEGGSILFLQSVNEILQGHVMPANAGGEIAQRLVQCRGSFIRLRVLCLRRIGETVDFRLHIEYLILQIGNGLDRFIVVVCALGAFTTKELSEFLQFFLDAHGHRSSAVGYGR